MFGENTIHGELVDGMLRPLLRGTLAYVGLEVLPPFIGYHVLCCCKAVSDQIIFN
jgi:NAD(P)H dehydrogenase (quinone)